MKPTSTTSPLRILAVSALWQGANDYAFVRAFRRAGHSVRAISEHQYFPPWQNMLLRLARRFLKQQIVEEYNAALLREVRMLRPDLFFVFKGPLVQAKTLRAIRDMGTICIQFYPDTGFRAHSRQLWDAISEYDWFFSTKPNHAKELRHSHRYDRVSFLPHGFDPETHRPVVTTTRDISDYSCDVSFIGNISTKKRATLAKLVRETGDLDMAIWGPAAWGAQGGALGQAYRGSPVFGLEYAKAIRLSKINLGLLFEGNSGGAAADVVTSRSFHIPASGGFMLHERTEEAESFFEDGMECAFFHGPEELVEKTRYYLEHEDERRQIAEAGRRRCLTSGYSIDDRAAAVIEKYHELRGKAGASEAGR